MKLVALLLIVLSCTACANASKISYEVTSRPPQAPVEVNGVNMGETPTVVSLRCSKTWVGLMNAPGGWANSSGNYKVTAYPPKNSAGQSQSKFVDPCQWEGEGNPKIFFDLNLESVAPTQRIEVTTNQATPPPNRERAIDALKTLRDQGVISDDEYNKKILELVR
ncbi:SHOCT domain-containing protein [Methylococcus geothermalis]|uniref:PEGA domain-containing protein n=1 Tax=Methylococcus geothermalis TaxID=2681310 RepID=A0A858QB61_9GAMM|nr:SHOCT domain-containing protein [Methylococcus geothermalis]QJD30955.1 PEGA domain-containing protein [Methylococcus geothermalis]